MANNRRNFLSSSHEPRATSGFTLIEILVVVALMGIMIAIGSNIFVGVIKSSTKSAILSQVRADGSRALENMSRTIQNAAEVVNPDQATPNDASCNTRDFIIVKNRSQTPGVTQQLYTRYTFVRQTAPANNFIAINSGNDKTVLANLNAQTPTPSDLITFKTGAITTFEGKTSVHVPSMCFRVQRANGVTIVSVSYVLQQGREATVSRKEFEATVDFNTTYSLRVY